MHLYMIGRLKSICKFKEKQVADTSVTKRASAIVNIKPVQIQRLPQRHLHKQITPWYRYIRHQKSKYIIAPPISITVHLKARKDYALLLSFVGQARLQFAGLHSLFLALWCIVIERCGTMRRFTFLVSDVSISWVHILLQIPPHKNYIHNACPAKFYSFIH